MATGSTIYAVRAAIVEALKANTALTDVQVSHGYPGEAFVERESIYVDRVTGAHKVANIKAGRKQRDETYAVTVVIAVVNDDSSVAETEATALGYLQEVEDLVADDPSLGDVNGVVHATAGDFRMLSDLTANGAACVIEFDINVTARLI